VALVGSRAMILAGTSKIHAETFGSALGGNAPEGWSFLVGVSPDSAGQIKKLREKGVKVAAYWIGSDSACAVQDPSYRANVPECDIHLGVHERIQQELSMWGVKSNVVYPCARNYSDGEPPPDNKCVGVYMPHTGSLYMYKQCVQVAKENPDLPFYFYGMAGYPGLPDNCIDGGRIKPEDSPKISVMLRLCEHDGFPVGGIEAKMRGLHVIENFPYPGFLHAKNLDDVNNYLQSDIHDGDQTDWPAWYREQCSPQRFNENVRKLCV